MVAWLLGSDNIRLLSSLYEKLKSKPKAKKIKIQMRFVNVNFKCNL